MKSCQSWAGSGDPIRVMTVSWILFFNFGLLPWKASCQQPGRAAEAKRAGCLPRGRSGKFKSEWRIYEEWRRMSWHLLKSYPPETSWFVLFYTWFYSLSCSINICSSLWLLLKSHLLLKWNVTAGLLRGPWQREDWTPSINFSLAS